MILLWNIRDDYSVDEMDDWVEWVKAQGKDNTVNDYNMTAYQLRREGIDNH